MYTYIYIYIYTHTHVRLRVLTSVYPSTGAFSPTSKPAGFMKKTRAFPSEKHINKETNQHKMTYTK